MARFYGVKRSGSSKVRIERSVFLGELQSVSGGEGVTRRISSIRRQYPDASHQPYAYRIQDAGTITEYSTDDGEPSGTAGRPILEVLQGGCLIDVLLVVTRYFGGRKLGTGRLRQSFRDAARKALDDSQRAEVVEARRVVLRFAIDLTGIVNRVVRRRRCVIEEETYGDDVELKVLLPTDILQDTVSELGEAMRDRGEISVSSGIAYLFS